MTGKPSETVDSINIDLVAVYDADAHVDVASKVKELVFEEIKSLQLPGAITLIISSPL